MCVLGRTGRLTWSVASAQAVLEMFCGEKDIRCVSAWSHSALMQGADGMTSSVANAQMKLACARRVPSIHHISVA